MDYGYIQDVEVDSDDEDSDSEEDNNKNENGDARGHDTSIPSIGPSDAPAAVDVEQEDVAPTQQENAGRGAGGGGEVAEETMEPESPTARVALPAAPPAGGHKASDSHQMRFAPKRMFMDEVGRKGGKGVGGGRARFCMLFCFPDVVVSLQFYGRDVGGADQMDTWIDCCVVG